MTINTAITKTAVTKRGEGSNNWTVRSPLASFVAQGSNKPNALSKFIEMLGAYMYAQQRHAQSLRRPGRPSKNYDAHIHVQVQAATKGRFDAVAEEYKLSQSETIVFLLECLDILKEEFATEAEMQDAENRVLQTA